MSKFQWHCTRKGEKAEVVRHYKHLTKLYQFILRNPAMFGGREVTIYNHNEKVIDMHYNEIRYRNNLRNRETTERREIIARGKLIHEGNCCR